MLDALALPRPPPLMTPISSSSSIRVLKARKRRSAERARRSAALRRRSSSSAAASAARTALSAAAATAPASAPTLTPGALARSASGVPILSSAAHPLMVVCQGPCALPPPPWAPAVRRVSSPPAGGGEGVTGGEGKEGGVTRGDERDVRAQWRPPPRSLSRRPPRAPRAAAPVARSC